MNKGLYEMPGFSATCKAAARASWLALPVTKLSKLKFRLRRARSGVTGGAARWPAAGARGAASAARAAASTSFTSISRPPSSAARRAILARKRSRTRSRTKRFGAVRTRVPESAALDSGDRGRIQVLNCCAGTSCSSRRRQACQRLCIFERIPCALGWRLCLGFFESAREPRFYPFRIALSTAPATKKVDLTRLQRAGSNTALFPIERANEAEANLPAIQDATRANARLSGAQPHRQRSGGAARATGEGAQASRRVGPSPACCGTPGRHASRASGSAPTG